MSYNREPFVNLVEPPITGSPYNVANEFGPTPAPPGVNLLIDNGGNPLTDNAGDNLIVN